MEYFTVLNNNINIETYYQEIYKEFNEYKQYGMTFHYFHNRFGNFLTLLRFQKPTKSNSNETISDNEFKTFAIDFNIFLNSIKKKNNKFAFNLEKDEKETYFLNSFRIFETLKEPLNYNGIYEYRFCFEEYS